MAKIYVELDPDDLSEKDKLFMMTDGWKFRSSLFEMDQYLRGRIKYEELTEEVADNLQKARDKLWEIVEEHGLEIE